MDPTPLERSLGPALARGLEVLGLALSAPARGQLLRYLALLEKWNRVYNLTAVRAPADMVARHLLDALSVEPHLSGARILDVGTGAGLPGLPLAVACPRRHFTLLDSSAKKIRFVTQAAAELGLANVTPVRVRVEAYRPDAPFDTVVSRAFASVADFVERAGALCRIGGRLLAMKGTDPAAELAGLAPGYSVADVIPLAVPGLDAQRHLVVLTRQA